MVTLAFLANFVSLSRVILSWYFVIILMVSREKDNQLLRKKSKLEFLQGIFMDTNPLFDNGIYEMYRMYLIMNGSVNKAIAEHEVRLQ